MFPLVASAAGVTLGRDNRGAIHPAVSGGRVDVTGSRLCRDAGAGSKSAGRRHERAVVLALRTFSRAAIWSQSPTTYSYVRTQCCLKADQHTSRDTSCGCRSAREPPRLVTIITRGVRGAGERAIAVVCDDQAVRRRRP